MGLNDRVIASLKESPDLHFRLFLCGISLVMAFLSLQILDIGRPRHRPVFLTPPRIERFMFGMKEQAADALWIRALQDFDYCEREISNRVCQSDGWLYRVLDLITDLSPRFRIAYATGGLALTILVNDLPGASKIFNKGLQTFPKDLPLLERAAYHALYEEHDDRKAADLLERAARNGAPPWYHMLAVRLYNRQGQTNLAEALLKALESESYPDPLLLKTLREKIARQRGRPGSL